MISWLINWLFSWPVSGRSVVLTTSKGFDGLQRHLVYYEQQQGYMSPSFFCMALISRVKGPWK